MAYRTLDSRFRGRSRATLTEDLLSSPYLEQVGQGSRNTYFRLRDGIHPVSDALAPIGPTLTVGPRGVWTSARLKELDQVVEATLRHEHAPPLQDIAKEDVKAQLAELADLPPNDVPISHVVDIVRLALYAAAAGGTLGDARLDAGGAAALEVARGARSLSPTTFEVALDTFVEVTGLDPFDYATRGTRAAAMLARLSNLAAAELMASVVNLAADAVRTRSPNTIEVFVEGLEAAVDSDYTRDALVKFFETNWQYIEFAQRFLSKAGCRGWA